MTLNTITSPAAPAIIENLEEQHIQSIESKENEVQVQKWMGFLHWSEIEEKKKISPFVRREGAFESSWRVATLFAAL